MKARLLGTALLLALLLAPCAVAQVLPGVLPAGPATAEQEDASAIAPPTANEKSASGAVEPDGQPAANEESVASASGAVEPEGPPAATASAAEKPRAAAKRGPVLAEKLLRRALPEGFFGEAWLGLRPWQWLGLLIVLAMAAVAAWVGERIFSRIGKALAARTDTPYDDALLAVIRRPVRFGLLLFIVHVLVKRLDLPAEGGEAIASGLTMLGVVAVGWFFLAVVDVLAQAARTALHERGERSAAAVVPLGSRVAKALVLAFAMLTLLGDAGVDVKKLWASLGIGAIAVALAAQKTLEDVFGGLTLILTQPVRVGDTCKVAGVTGKVEDIALRRTTLRTADKALLSIPNAQFAAAQVENLSRKKTTRFVARLVLSADTPSAKLAEVLDALRRALEAEQQTTDEGRHARLVATSAAGLEVELQAHVTTTDGEEFLALQEALLLASLAAAERCGVRLAVAPAPLQRPA